MNGDAFAVLGVAPTLDPAEIKRAYFRALAEHPPHKDPQGFRRLRDAYEALQKPGALTAAYQSAPLNIPVVLAPYEARYGERLAALRQELEQRVGVAQQAELFGRAVQRLTYEEAVRLFALVSQ